MPRFFFDPADMQGTSLRIKGNDYAHITKVLRFGIGDTIEICDGLGKDYLAYITSVTNDYLTANVKFNRLSIAEPDLKVTLYQSISKGDKMDEVVQKCTELGVNRIVPIVSSRTIVKLKKDNDSKAKVMRWRKIALEASKQSGRGIIPDVSNIMSFNEALVNKGNTLGVIASEHERIASLKDVLPKSGFLKEVSVLTGPEGGWDKEEIQSAQDKGWISFTLGPRIMRTETVGVAILSVIMFIYGEMQWKQTISEKWHSIP